MTSGGLLGGARCGARATLSVRADLEMISHHSTAGGYAATSRENLKLVPQLKGKVLFGGDPSRSGSVRWAYVIRVAYLPSSGVRGA